MRISENPVEVEAHAARSRFQWPMTLGKSKSGWAALNGLPDPAERSANADAKGDSA
jgi:hypothetical protein